MLTVVAAMLGKACAVHDLVLHNDAAEMHGNQSMVSVVGQVCAVHYLVLHNDAAEMHGNEAVLGIVSVVGQARVVHDLVLHNDAAEMHGNEAVLGIVPVVGQARVVHDLVLHDAAVIHEDSMIQTALLAVGFSLANTFFHFSVAFGVVVAVCSWVENSMTAVIHENGVVLDILSLSIQYLEAMLVLSCVVHDLVPHLDSTNPLVLLQIHSTSSSSDLSPLLRPAFSSCRFVVASAFLHFSISGRPAAVLLSLAVASVFRTFSPKIVASAFPKIVAFAFLFLSISLRSAAAPFSCHLAETFHR